MTDHRLDQYSFKEWFNNREKINAEECFHYLAEIQDLRIQDIIIKHIYLNMTFRDIAQDYAISFQRIHQLYHDGINEIKRKLGLME